MQGAKYIEALMKAVADASNRHKQYSDIALEAIRQFILQPLAAAAGRDDGVCVCARAHVCVLTVTPTFKPSYDSSVAPAHRDDGGWGTDPTHKYPSTSQFYVRCCIDRYGSPSWPA